MTDNNRIIWGAILTITLFHATVYSADGAQKLKAKPPAHLQKAFVNTPVNKNLPNVLILGDSISIGYTVPVRKLLEGKANVFRPRTNCAHTGVGVKNIKKWVGEKEWDVIHFNFGIWDAHYLHQGKIVSVKNLSKHKREDIALRHTTEQYIENLKKILTALKQTNAKLIWASTTPRTSYGAEAKTNILKNNQAAAELMKAQGAQITDLYQLVLPHVKTLQTKDGTHFTIQGSNALAKEVARTISAALHSKLKSE